MIAHAGRKFNRLSENPCAERQMFADANRRRGRGARGKRHPARARGAQGGSRQDHPRQGVKGLSGRQTRDRSRISALSLRHGTAEKQARGTSRKTPGRRKDRRDGVEIKKERK